MVQAPTYLQKLGEIRRCDFSEHVAFREALKLQSDLLIIPGAATSLRQFRKILERRTISANSANRTQNFSSCTFKTAAGRPFRSAPNTVAALLELLSYNVSFPSFMLCNCDNVPFLHSDTSGSQAWFVTLFNTALAAP
jgi:hypothetical protein